MTNELKKAIEIVKSYLDMDSDVDSEYLNAQRTIIDALEAQPTEVRDATEEERKSVKDYIESISKPTGVHFYKAQPTDAVDKRSLDSVINTLQTWIKTADDEYDREEYWRVEGLWEALQEIKKIKTFKSSTNAIDRDTVIYYIKSHIREIISESGADKNEHTNRILRGIINGVETMPSVTPQRPKGKWIQTKDECDGVNFYDFSFECSKCGKEQSFKSNYCPNCGAEMSGGGEE